MSLLVATLVLCFTSTLNCLSLRTVSQIVQVRLANQSVLSVQSAQAAQSAQAVLPSKDQLREQFYRASENSDDADVLTTMLADVGEQNPLHFGYKGIADMLQAKFSYNPYSKLKYFRSGKQKLERAIALAPANIELRFLRFAVQAKAPSILGYSDNLDEDKKLLFTYIQQQRTKLEDRDLLHRIVRFMKGCELCNSSEKDMLRGMD